MGLSLHQSVGKGAVNRQADVKLIQVLLNTFTAWKKARPLLKADGAWGAATLDAIKQFQGEAAGATYPDGVIDPNGKTFRFLTMYLIEPGQQAAIEKQARTGQMTAGGPVIDLKTIRRHAGLSGQSVVYASEVSAESRLVSEYSLDVVKVALKESGMTRAEITSTVRSPLEQAAAMLVNAKRDLKSQLKLYNEEGDLVLKVYVANKVKPDKEITKLMAAEIEKLEKSGKRVSNHSFSKEAYAKLNVFDIGCFATAGNDPERLKRFTTVLQKLTDDGYIKRFINEASTNQCWHLEIQPNLKGLAFYESGTILNIARTL